MLHNNLPKSFATQTRDGLMSSEDKIKVDNLSNENNTNREDINNLQKVYSDLKEEQK